MSAWIGARSLRLLAALFITALAFVRAFGLHRFHDDFAYPIRAHTALRDHAVAEYIWSPFGRHWSPLWNAFTVLNMWAVGWQTDLLVRSATVILVLAGLLVFARIAGRLGLSAGATIAGMAVLGWHHVRAAAYYSFDCYSQVAADLCTWTVVSVALAVAVDPGTDRRRRPLIAAWALFVVGLLVKEQALATLAGLAVVALWFTVVRPVPARRAIWTLLAAVVAAGAAFAWLRAAYGVTVDAAGAASLCWRCAPNNMALMAGALLLPVRTLEVYLALHDPGANIARLVAAGAGASIVIVGIVAGLAAHPKGDVARGRVSLIIALVVASFFPTSLLAHVGELYAHTAVFWFALLAAYAVDGLRLRARQFSLGVGRAMVAGAVAYAAALFVGLTLNLADMRATGERAAALIDGFRDTIAPLPAGSTVVVHGLYGGKGPGEYGLYRLTSPGPLLGQWGGALGFVAPAGLAVIEDDELLLADPADPRLQRRVFIADFSSGALVVREPAASSP